MNVGRLRGEQGGEGERSGRKKGKRGKPDVVKLSSLKDPLNDLEGEDSINSSPAIVRNLWIISVSSRFNGIPKTWQTSSNCSFAGHIELAIAG